MPLPITAPARADDAWRALVNPHTGERMLVLRSAASTGGALAEVQFDLPPGAAAGPLHVHTRFAETFEVLSGALEVTHGRPARRATLGAGDALRVAPGTPHTFRNASADWVTLVVTARPAARFEQFLRLWYGLAADGRTRADGTPANPLHLALALDAGDVALAGAPVAPQRALLALARAAARLAGVEQALARRYWAPAGAGDPS